MNFLKIVPLITALSLCGNSFCQSNQSQKSMKMDTMNGGQATHTPDTIKMGKTALVPQTTCPVLGGEIDKNLFVDYKGKRIYVCCAGCINDVKKDPEKYIKKLESMGQSVEIIGNPAEKPNEKMKM
jgi:YHS domain-containing protein